MTATVDKVQSVQTRSGKPGHGFNLCTTGGKRWVTLCYETRDEAESARQAIQSAIENALAVEIDRD